MHVLVVTAVHTPEDARIRHRQMPALLAAGHRVTFVAPFEACGVQPGNDITAISIPRAVGRRRIASLRAARRVIKDHRNDADIVLLHDPELVLALTGLRGLPPVVWDDHEDTAAAMTLKPWLPGPLRPLGVWLARLTERTAERRFHIILADEGYRPLFGRQHPVVPNTTYVPASVPPPGDSRVIHVGHLTVARGALEMIELGRLLGDRNAGVSVELIGDAGPDARDQVAAAHSAGHVVWHGFLPNDRALALTEGSLAGLSLRRDEANYRNSWATKAIEYMARGVPVITTPTPPAPDVVGRHHAGLVVPFEDPAAAADAVQQLKADPELRLEMARRGHEAALREYAWPVHAAEFVAHLERWAGTA